MADAVGVGRPSMRDNKIAIVCSARSTDTKAEGTTNRFIPNSHPQFSSPSFYPWEWADGGWNGTA